MGGIRRSEVECKSVHVGFVFVINVGHGNHFGVSISVEFNGSDHFVFFVGIRSINVVPLLMEIIFNLDIGVDIVVFTIKSVGSELGNHTVLVPRSLEHRDNSVSSG